MKKTSRRSKDKTASLQKRYNTRIRQEYIDQDYIHKLDDTKKTCTLKDGTKVTELEYMAAFMKEWNSAGVGKQSEARKNKLHRTKKEVKACTDRNNQRNADIYAIAKARNRVYNADAKTLADYIDKNVIVTQDNVEDSIIDYLDQVKNFDKSTDNGDK